MEWGFSEWGNGKKGNGKSVLGNCGKAKKAEKRKYIEGEIGIHIWICFLDGEMGKMEMGKQDGGMVAY